MILIWTLPNKESQWYTRLDAINQDVEHHAHEDVYTGVGIANRNRVRFTTHKKLTDRRGGGRAGRDDIDWAHPVHRKPNLPPSLEQAGGSKPRPRHRAGPDKGSKGRTAGQSTGTAGTAGWRWTPRRIPPLLKFEALLKANPKFRRSWEQDRKDMTDQSASAYDLSMATIALGAGWSDQEVVSLLICWRRKHGHDLKLRENYYGVTLDKAKEPIEIAQAEEQLSEALAQPP